MQILEYLDQAGVTYEKSAHSPTFTAQRMAAEEHEKGRYVAKPVIVKADSKFIMCVLAAPNKVDLDTLRSQLGAKKVELAQEREIADIFTDCELGAEPPFGNLYNITTILDRSLEDDDHIMFQAGSHDSAITMRTSDYLELVQPKVLDLSYRTVV